MEIIIMVVIMVAVIRITEAITHIMKTITIPLTEEGKGRAIFQPVGIIIQSLQDIHEESIIFHPAAILSPVAKAIQELRQSQLIQGEQPQVVPILRRQPLPPKVK